MDKTSAFDSAEDDDDNYTTPPPTPERSMEAPGSSPLQARKCGDEVERTTSLYVTELVDVAALHASDSSENLNQSELSDDEESLIDEDDDFKEEDYYDEPRPKKAPLHVNLKRRPEPKKPLKTTKKPAPATSQLPPPVKEPVKAQVIPAKEFVAPTKELVTPKFDRIDALAIVATSDFKIMEFQAAYNGLLQREAAQQTTIRELIEQLNQKDARIRHLEKLLCSAPSAASPSYQRRSTQISVASLLSN